MEHPLEAEMLTPERSGAARGAPTEAGRPRGGSRCGGQGGCHGLRPPQAAAAVGRGRRGRSAAARPGVWFWAQRLYLRSGGHQYRRAGRVLVAARLLVREAVLSLEVGGIHVRPWGGWVGGWGCGGVWGCRRARAGVGLCVLGGGRGQVGCVGEFGDLAGARPGRAERAGREAARRAGRGAGRRALLCSTAGGRAAAQPRGLT